MSATDALVAALVTAGMEVAEALGMVARAGAEMAAGPSKGALRTRKWRAKLPSQSVTCDASETDNDSVTKRHKASQSVTSDKAPLSYLLTESQNKHSEKKEKREVKRASQLPDDWRPDERVWQASTALIGADRCELELKKFHRHAADKGRVSKRWSAAFENWIEKAIEYGAKNGNGNSINRTNPTAGPPQTRDAAVIASMARTLEQRRQDRAANRSADQRVSGANGAAGGDDAEPGASGGDAGPRQQLAFLPRADAGRG